MKLPGDTGFASDAELEVELSAQDLIGLTPIQVKPAQPTLQLVSSDALRATSATITAAAPTMPAAVRVPARMLSPRVMGAAAASIVAVLAIGILFESAPPQRVVERPVSNWSPVPDPVVNEVEEAPTLVANPFDRTEVFELPAGISHEEAKAMVADLLLKRASERQVYSSTRR